jgi:hypothetical protein
MQLLKRAKSTKSFFKIIVYLTLIIFINYSFGCTKTVTETISRNQQSYNPDIKINHLTLLDGTGIVFDSHGGKLSKTATPDSSLYIITGNDIMGRSISCKMNDVLDLGIEKKEFDSFNTFISIVYYVPTATLLLFVILLAFVGGDLSGGSCPHVYSFNGNNFVFDTECYTGATSLQLKKTEYSRLKFIKETNNSYQILLKSDPRSEIQYTDKVGLRITDFDKDYEIYSDNNGRLFAIKNSIPPALVIDENNKNLINFFKSSDNISWQSIMPKDSSYRQNSLTNRIVFTFPTPKGLKNPKLIIKAGSSFWGNEMTGRFAKLRMKKGEINNNDIKNDNAFKILDSLCIKAQLYNLNIKVFCGSDWVTKGIFSTGGGILEEERIIDLNLADYNTDSLKIMINPPIGFWKIDYIGLVNDYTENIEFDDISAITATDNNNSDISKLIRNNDGEYFVMSKADDWTKLTFDASPVPDNKKRTIFFISSGYYEKFSSEFYPEAENILKSFSLGHRSLLEYSLDGYLEWINKYANKVKY